MLKKIMYYVPSVVVPLLINVVILFLYGRYLPPDEYGLMNIYSTTISLLYSFGLAFVQTAALRFYTDERCKDKSVYFTTFVLTNVGISVLLLGVAALIKLFIPEINILLISISVLANGLYMLCVNLDRLEDRHLMYTAERCLAAILDLAAFIVLAIVLGYANHISPIVSLYGSYLLIALIKLVMHRKLLNVKKFSPEIFRDSMKFGLPLIGVSVAGSLIAHSDQYMLKFFMDNTAVGLYSLGYKIADYSLTRFTNLLLIVATPAIIKHYDQGKKDSSRKTIISTVDSILWLWFALISFCLMYSTELIQFIFPNYVGSEVTMQIVIVAALFHCISMLYCKPFELIKNTRLSMVYSIIAGLINVAYNWIFIPIQGTVAAAISSVLAYLALDIMMFFGSRKYMDLTPDFKVLFKNLLIAAFTCGTAVLLKHLWHCGSTIIFLAQVVICGIVYVGLSFGTGLFQQVFQISRKFSLRRRK